MAPAIEAGAALSPVRAGAGNATRVSPARSGHCPADRLVRDQQKASARPGGDEAPARGGAGAGRGLWPPAGQGAAWRCGRGDGPCQRRGGSAFASAGGRRKRDPRFPARAGRSPVARQVRAPRKASARPGGREAPAGGGAGAGRGLWPPAGPDPGVARWQGRWPLPERPGIRENARPGGIGKRIAFPRPSGTVPRRSAGPGPAEGQRPTRRGRSVRQGRGGRWPGASAPVWS